MSLGLLAVSLLIARVLLALAMGCAFLRLLRGPRAQDRVLAFDALYLDAMLLVLSFGIGSGGSLYFDIALVMALFGFVGTVALAKFLLRGEVIE